MGFKQILVTLDGSEAAETALNYAEMIAVPEAHIHLLNVAPHAATQPIQAPSELYSAELMRDVNWPPLSSEEETQTLFEREDYLRGRGGWLTDKGFVVTSEIRFGNVVDTIIETGCKGFDVIVMTTHGRTGLARFALGECSRSRFAPGIMPRLAHICPCAI